ncbi:MAG: 6,7-dimethyl-8-ribityllumazine synthase [Bacteroidia bacterium]
MSKANLLPLPDHKPLLRNRKRFPLGFYFVATLWHQAIIDKMLKSAIEEIGDLNTYFHKLDIPGIKEWAVRRVAGAFEIPYACKELQASLKANQHSFISYETELSYAIITFGCILKGETQHNHYIAQSVFNALQTLNLQGPFPIILGILTPDTEEQAWERAEITARNCVRAALWQIVDAQWAQDSTS